MHTTKKTESWKLDKMIEYYQSGLSAKESAYKVGSSPQVCFRELKKRKIESRTTSSYMKVPQDILDKIVEDYLSGTTSRDATKKFGLSYSVCINELNRRNIPIRKSGSYQSPPKDDKDLMIQNYLNGMTSIEAAKSIGVSFTTCLKELKRRGISTRCHGSYRKLPINENYFETIDTDEKAYWLGFIYADGSLDEKRYMLHFTLKLSDKNHIEKFLKAIEYPGKIVEYFTNNGHWVAKISITNKKIVADLRMHGIYQNKSLTIHPIKLSNNELDRAYWRGIFDGDGCLSTEKAPTAVKGYINRVMLTGNIFTVLGFKEFLFYNKLEIGLPIKQGNIYDIKAGKRKDVISILHLLYDSASVYLDRKYNKHLEVCMN